MRYFILGVFFIIFSGMAFQANAQENSESGVTDQQSISKSIRLYPNPTTDFLYVKTGELRAEKVKLTLFNVLGNEEIVESEVVGDYELKIKVKDISSGYYLLAVKQDDIKFRGTYKFLKR